MDFKNKIDWMFLKSWLIAFYVLQMLSCFISMCCVAGSRVWYAAYVDVYRFMIVSTIFCLLVTMLFFVLRTFKFRISKYFRLDWNRATILQTGMCWFVLIISSSVMAHASGPMSDLLASSVFGYLAYTVYLIQFAKEVVDYKLELDCGKSKQVKVSTISTNAPLRPPPTRPLVPVREAPKLPKTSTAASVPNGKRFPFLLPTKT